MNLLAATCLLAASVAAADSSYRIEVSPVRRIEARLVTKIDMPAMSAREWILFAARAPELPGQTGLNTALHPMGRPAEESSPYGRPIVWARVPTGGRRWTSGITVEVRYEATLWQRRLSDRPPSESATEVASLSPRERRLALAASPTIDVKNPDLLAWIDASRLRRGEREGVIDFARRVHVDLATRFSYELLPEMDRRASQVCRAGKSDCAGLSALFAAVMRANEIAARLLVGRSVTKITDPRVPESFRARRPHVRAEFYVDDVGWVPVDVSREILTLSRQRTLYFGHDPGDMLVLHTDDELVLSTIHNGRQTVESLQGLRFWVVGEGTSEGSTMDERWEVRQLPLEKETP